MSLDLEMTATREKGRVRLALRGELTMTGTAAFEAKLNDLSDTGLPVLLDLSGLEFIDSSGLTALVQAVKAARRGGWQLDIDRDVSAFLAGRLHYTGVDRLLGW